VLIEVIIVQFGVTYSWYGKNRMFMDQPSCRNRYSTRRGSASNFNSPRTSRDIKPVTDLEMEETVCGLAAKARAQMVRSLIICTIHLKYFGLLHQKG
jgi:hypothetical protein